MFPRLPWRLVVAALLLLIGLVALNWYVDVDRDDLERAIDQAGVIGPAAYAVILALGLTVPFNPVSDLLTVAVAALLLDPAEAILASFGAQAFAVTVNYAVARRYGARLLDGLMERRDVPLVRRLRDRITVRSVFMLRFALPLTAVGIDVVGYLAGIQRLRFVPYFIASMVPWTLMSVVYFTSAAALREVSPILVMVPAVLILLAASGLVLLVRRKTEILDTAPTEDELVTEAPPRR